MNFVDLLVIAGLVVVALIGWRSGLLATALGFFGFLAGAMAAALGIPALLAGQDLPVMLNTGAVLVGIVVAGLLGQALLGWLGRMLREAITFRPVRLLDSLGGLAISALAFTISAWLLLSVLSTATFAGSSEQVRNSRSYTTLERFMAVPTEGILSEVRRLLDNLDLPRIPFNEALLPPVAEPSDSAVSAAARQAAKESVAAVEASSRQCRRNSSGSAVVVGPGLAVTNSHVVAGADAVYIQLTGQPRMRATVVYRDPGLDIAVLRVPGLSAPAPRWVASASRGSQAVVAGYPMGGSLHTRPARIRGQASVPADNGGGSREVYVFRGRVEPGNSGGALLNPKGQVVGLVFASAKEDHDTGFALQSDDVAAAVHEGSLLTKPVSTGGCVTH